MGKETNRKNDRAVANSHWLIRPVDFSLFAVLAASSVESKENEPYSF